MKVLINNNEYEFNKDITILEACHEIGIKIPTLCFLKDINEEASCRMCVVELNPMGNLVTACTTKIKDGMDILTNSPKVISSRKKTLELILNNHNKTCLSCSKNGYCELQKLAKVYDIDLVYDKENIEVIHEDENSCIIRDNSKCILCNRCVNYCKKVMGVEAIKRIGRGNKTYIGSAYNKKLSETKCVSCGGCISVCPTGALREKDNIERVLEALRNDKLEVVVSYAPATRVTIGEEFGYRDGENVSNKLNSALRLLGFKEVFDITFGADMTILEEGEEFISRLKSKTNLPLMTSCCPAWVNFIQNFYPEYINNLSSVKSPMGITGSLYKTYYCEKNHLNPKNVFFVSVMPCVAKKTEIDKRSTATKYNDVDVSLTVRELVKMIKMAGINLKELEGSDFSSLIGKGNSIIFGNSGGVMESALRYAKEKLENKGSRNLVYKEIRGMKGIKEASYIINKQQINVLVVSGLSNIKNVIESGILKKYHFIEVMACPNGCINGAGNPYMDGYTRSFSNYIKKRSQGLYGIENNLKSCKAKDNILVKNIYKEYLDCPGSSKAHQILHTKYKK